MACLNILLETAAMKKSEGGFKQFCISASQNAGKLLNYIVSEQRKREI